ncbi:MAG: hypothetical protein ACTJHU_00250 [Mycetocola sp.]
MKIRSKLTITSVVALAAFALAAPMSATAVQPSHTSTTINAVDYSAEELASGLEELFTEAIILDESGIASIDEDKLRSLIGDAEASKILQQYDQATPQSSPRTMKAMAAKQSFVDCMVQNSVLGLITGISTGVYGEYIRKQQWQELAEKLLPRLVKAGVGGGVAGVVVGLAASAVQCSVFNK